MNTQNPTFPFYGKTSTGAIFKFDSEYEGTCVEASYYWSIGDEWENESCLDKFYITPLTDEEIKDNNLPDLKQMNKFPLRAKHISSNLVVEFESTTIGTVIVGNELINKGHQSFSWVNCLDSKYWTILPPETVENKKEMKLPDEFYILTENAAYWAAIEAKLLKLGYKHARYTTKVEYNDWAYIRVDSEKILQYDQFIGILKRIANNAVEITMAELFAIPDPPAFVEKSIFFQGYDGTIKEDRLKIGCQTIKYENLAEIKQKVDEFMSLEFLLNDKFEDTRTNVKINHEGITVTTAGEIKTISFSSFSELLEELSPAMKPKNK